MRAEVVDGVDYWMQRLAKGWFLWKAIVAIAFPFIAATEGWLLTEMGVSRGSPVDRVEGRPGRFAAAGDASVLLITHRPEGLELVDEVLTLRAGRIERTPQNAAATTAAQ